jgi:hypothetical protein
MQTVDGYMYFLNNSWSLSDAPIEQVVTSMVVTAVSWRIILHPPQLYLRRNKASVFQRSIFLQLYPFSIVLIITEVRNGSDFDNNLLTV